MRDKQMTAVDWLVEQLQAPCRGIPSHILEQAKKMEKEQMQKLIIWMYKVSADQPMRFETDIDDIVEQYYNETYNSKS